MGGIRQRHTTEFKLEAIRLIEAGTKSTREIADDLGVSPAMLYRWHRQARVRGGAAAPDVFPGTGHVTSQDEEIRRLKRENARLREERDFLRSATVFFAKESR